MQLVSSIALLVGAAPFQGAGGRERSCQDAEPRRTSPPAVGNAMLLPQVPGAARRVHCCFWAATCSALEVLWVRGA